MMEYRRLLPFLALVIAVLTINLPSSSARRRPPADDYDIGSGNDDDLDSVRHNDDENDVDVGSGVDIEEGSTDDDDPNRGPPVYHSPSRSPDVGFDETSRSRTTASVVEVNPSEDQESDGIKVEALKALITHPAVLAAIIIGGILTILFIVLLIMFIIYRMRKKDEGSYVLDDPKVAMIDHQQPQQTNALIYTKGPSNDQEFYA